MNPYEEVELKDSLISQIQLSKWRSHKITQSCVDNVEKGEGYKLSVDELRAELCFLERLYQELENLNGCSGVSS